jgi:hypothetical protein
MRDLLSPSEQDRLVQLYPGGNRISLGKNRQRFDF